MAEAVKSEKSQGSAKDHKCHKYLPEYFIMDIQLLLNNKQKGHCPKCKKRFSDPNTALRHFKHVHCEAYVCPHCEKTLKVFGRPKALKSHYLSCKILKSKLMFDVTQIDQIAETDYNLFKTNFAHIKNTLAQFELK
eukprot:NODE_369_length_8668_cov_1.088575.p7 type:complete len:136 gc:universal NODE_369_length_8668_cov_1.088575:2252-2659(+)